MSIFPTGAPGSAGRPTIAGRGARHETGGALARPIRGQIYLIEEADLELFPDGAARSPRSGLVSRH